MSTFTQILYQIVFSTYKRKPTLLKAHRPDLFKYMAQTLQNKDCKVYLINGVEDHIHILTHLHPSVALADLVKDLKISSSLLLKSEIYPSEFDGWQEGYGGFTYSIRSKGRLYKYIENQEKHHRKTSSRDEFIGLLNEHDIPFKEEYLL